MPNGASSTRIPDLADQIEDETIDVEDVKQVEAEAVLRSVRNPDGYASETDGTYAYTFSRELASGKLQILPDDWAVLGITAPWLCSCLRSALRCPLRSGVVADMASLLHRGTEIVTVFPDEMIIDGEGNKKMRPSATGIVCRAVVQPITTTEDAKVGYQTMSKYRLRLVGYSGNPSLSVLRPWSSGKAGGTASTGSR